MQFFGKNFNEHIKKYNTTLQGCLACKFPMSLVGQCDMFRQTDCPPVSSPRVLDNCQRTRVASGRVALVPWGHGELVGEADLKGGVALLDVLVEVLPEELHLPKLLAKLEPGLGCQEGANLYDGINVIPVQGGRGSTG
jgi:hypothetical protein